MTSAAEASIRACIEEAAEPVDPVDALVDRSRDDPGAPFEPDNLALLQQLQRDDQARFERVRKGLKDAGVRVSEMDLRLRSKGSTSPASNNGGQGSSLLPSPPCPWPDPVDGELLLDELSSTIRCSLVVPEEAASAISLWAVYTHAHDLFQISPRLSFTSPEKRCGKTTALAVLQRLVAKPLVASNITAAAVFRTVEAEHPTLLIDEADTFLRKNDELRGILNSGHNRSTAGVIRTVGDAHEPKRFDTWTPVAIAMIGRLPDTLADRSIEILMRRKKQGEHVARFRLDRTGALEELHRKIIRWVRDNETTIGDWDGPVPNRLHDRAADNWRPLFAIADVVGGAWPEQARQAALALTPTEDASPGVKLLEDIRDIFDEVGDDRLLTQELLERLHAKEHRPWAEYKMGKPLSATQLANLLRPYAVSPNTIRSHEAVAKGYTRASFEDAFARYLPQQSVTPLQPAENLNFSGIPAVTDEAPVTAPIGRKLAESTRCNGVTARTANAGPEEAVVAGANLKERDPWDGEPWLLDRPEPWVGGGGTSGDQFVDDLGQAGSDPRMPIEVEQFVAHSIVKLLAADDGEWTEREWASFFDEVAGQLEFDHGRSREHAEALAAQRCLVTWLERHPQG